MLVTINVTREDIREADMTDYTQCMVGRAFRRVIDKSFEEVGVIYDYAHVDEKSFSVPTYVSELIWRQTTRTLSFCLNHGLTYNLSHSKWISQPNT
jgi:hypothetical protein